jgi:hypothetical protein
MAKDRAVGKAEPDAGTANYRQDRQAISGKGTAVALPETVIGAHFVAFRSAKGRAFAER